MNQESIMAMHSQGLVCLREASYMKAASVFRLALRKLLSHVSDNEVSTPHGEMNVQAVSVEGLTKSNMSDYSCVALYDRAIACMTAISDDEIASSTKLQNKISALLLYNMGLTYHLMGLTDAGTMNLKKALKLYKMAAEICNNDADVSSICLVSLAISNNMCHIYSCFFNAAEMQKCFAWQRSVMSYIRCAGGVPEDFLHFQMNVMLLNESTPQAAAAA
jgi:tetratricopeptide (TPR) repeat protein